MLLQLFLEKNLAFHFYYSEESVKNNKITAKNIYIVAPGLPQFTYRDFFKNKVNKDTAFFYLYYPGSFFNGGKFSFKNCVNSIDDAISFVEGRKGVRTFDNKKLSWDYSNLILMGNSFGGNVILSANIKKEKVKKIILFSPFFVEFSNVKDNQKILGFLSRGYRNNFRGIESKEWKNYFDKKDKMSFIKLDESLPPVKIIHGGSDSTVPPQVSQKLAKKYPSLVSLKLKNGIGHSFEDLYEI